MASHLQKQAFEAERDAANLLRDRLDMEPTRSILYKGAAVIALQCGLNADAQEMARQGLAGKPTEDILEQLQSVLDKSMQSWL